MDTGIVLDASFLIFVTMLKTYRMSPSASPADRTPTQGGGEAEGDILYLTSRQNRGGAWGGERSPYTNTSSPHANAHLDTRLGFGIWV